MQTNFYSCPICSNEEVFNLPVIYEMGRSRCEVSGFTYNGDIGVFNGSGTKSSLLSERCAPPKKPSYFEVFLLGTICFFFLGEFLFKALLVVIIFILRLFCTAIVTFTAHFLNLSLIASFMELLTDALDNIDYITGLVPLKLVMLVLIAYHIYRVWYYQNRVWPKNYQRWRNSFICLRCNVIF